MATASSSNRSMNLDNEAVERLVNAFKTRNNGVSPIIKELVESALIKEAERLEKESLSSKKIS